MPTFRSSLIVVLVLALSLYGLFIYRTTWKVHGEFQVTLVDDAMVSMCYARNLASGAGLVWNVGEAPVEGFSNLLWVLVMAAFHMLSLPPSGIALAVTICSALALLGNIVIVWRIANEFSPRIWLGPALAIFLTAVYFPLVFWSLRGLELGLVCLLLNASTLCVIRLYVRPQRSAVWILIACLSLALLTRPDTIVQVSVLLLAGIALLLRAQKFASAVLLFCIVLATGIGLAVFRYLYFGDLFPNTYYLKVTGTGLGERMAVGFQLFFEKSGPRTLFFFCVAAGAFLLPDARLKKAVGFLGVLFLSQFVYDIYVGGDFAERLVGGENRFLAQAFGPLIIAYSVTVPHLVGLKPWERSGAAPFRLETVYVLLLVGLGSAALSSGKEWGQWRTENAPMLESDIDRMRLGLVLERGTRNDAVITVHAAGNIPYYSHRKTIDLLGKSDKVIARGPAKGGFVSGHNKWDYDYSIGTLRPDIIADEYGTLWEYLQKHPGEYELLPPHGIFVRPHSERIMPDTLSQTTW
jgi:arabinofuranosyltransferase